MKKFFKTSGFSGLIISFILIILYLNGFRIIKFASDANSMHPTLSPGDICLSLIGQNNFSRNTEAGRIVFIRHNNYNYLLTKRIIAHENDVISVNGPETRINGSLVREPYAVYSNAPRDTIRIDSLRIGKNKFFVMGDNRSSSWDSRYPEFGLIDMQDIKGRPLIILWSESADKIFYIF